MRTEGYKGYNRNLSPENGKLLLSDTPDFDLGLAKSAKLEAQHFVKSKGLPFSSPSLELAVALSIYNLRAGTDGNSQTESVLQSRLTSLILAEVNAKNSPLSTVGFEIESPTYVFSDVDSLHDNRYKPFFDLIGMPRNELNKDGKIPAFWEFAPKPSYSAAAQNRIISELIQGGFIPSLLNSQTIKDVARLFGERLVSLHINIGIPPNIDICKNIPGINELAIALAVAFSSAHRIEKRKMKSDFFIHVKPGDQTAKGNSRVELKAMEARTADMYRGIIVAQYLFTSLFDSLARNDCRIGNVWKEVSSQINDLFINYQYAPAFNLSGLDVNIEVARLAGRKGAASEMRNILWKGFREIKRIISTDSGGSQRPQQA